MELMIVNNSNQKAPRLFIEWWVEHLIKVLSRKAIRNKIKLKKSLTIVFVNKKQGQKINFEFRNKNYATDVLSFESMDEDSIGELIICMDVIAKQALQQKWAVKWELAYMITHGVLHLLGYDHELSPKEEKLMFSLQDEVFDVLVKSYKASKA